jgi:hypothetical protein
MDYRKERGAPSKSVVTTAVTERRRKARRKQAIKESIALSGAI